MGIRWRIRAYRRNQGYNIPESVGKATNRWYYNQNWDSYVPYLGWYIDSHMEYS